MLRYVIRRLLLSVPILLGITALTYVIINGGAWGPSLDDDGPFC